MNILPALAALSLLAQPPASADWRRASTNKPMVTFVDAGSLERKDDVVRFWTWSILRDPISDGNRYDNYKEFLEAGCREKSYFYRTIVYYRGTEKTKETGGEPPVRYAAPGSILEEVILRACDPEQLGQADKDPIAAARSYFDEHDPSAETGEATQHPVAGPSWRKAGVAADHVTFVDAASIDRTGGQVRFWLWTIYPGSTTDGSPVDNLKSLIAASCTDRTFKALATNVYLAKRLVRSFAADPAPESAVIGQVIDSACHPETLGEPFADPFAAAPEQLGKSGKR